ncbi:MAG: molybdate ABC transporter substrate-binding protein [Oribacterium parvum]|uniref:molybdate ABC transporter substrate-binding protein n=1 Tax=Oribacterium parvum TaxID=1501329 RepID=UPI001CB2DB8B|nr:molybdate ABC transporter substrate-binding protein [Oribacterium parvum]MBF1269151.1 molybdate ABC transporter substrate-binding protein [Oribacterium parvum]
MKKFVVGSLALVLSAMLISCGGAKKEETAAESSVVETESSKAETESAKETEKATEGEKTEVQVFIAASLKNVMEELGAQYEKDNPSVKLVFQADSSGKLLTQIQEGYACDVFFSAAQKQMDTLQEEGKLVEGTRKNVVNNQLCVITRKDSGTKVTGLETLKDAKSIALADGTVPVGRYTRKALVSLGILPEAEDLSKISTKEVSEALGGVEISEQSNVSKVLTAVVEGSSEVGTTYYSDTYGKEADIKILEKVPYDLTGNVIYPISQVVNDEASEEEVTEAKKFVEFVCSDAAKETFQKYYFDTNVE